MDNDRWTGRELRAADMPQITALLEKARKHESLFVRAALAQGTSFNGWWWGALKNGSDLAAVMAVENHMGAVYARDEEGANGFGLELYTQQKRGGPSNQANRHQLLGESKTMAKIWNHVKDIPFRKLLSDRECELLSCTTRSAECPSSRVEVTSATRADERVIIDFTAESTLERVQADPRKTNRDGHITRCQSTIASGRQLIAKEGGRPFFVAEIVSLGPGTALIDHVYIPPHFRARGRLIAAAFWHAAAHPMIAAGQEPLTLTTDSAIAQAAKQAGWVRATGYRWVITLG